MPPLFKLFILFEVPFRISARIYGIIIDYCMRAVYIHALANHHVIGSDSHPDSAVLK
jgi:hypothetical protein